MHSLPQTKVQIRRLIVAAKDYTVSNLTVSGKCYLVYGIYGVSYAGRIDGYWYYWHGQRKTLMPDKQKKHCWCLVILLVMGRAWIILEQRNWQIRKIRQMPSILQKKAFRFIKQMQKMLRKCLIITMVHKSLTKTEDTWKDADETMLDTDKVNTLLSYLTTIKASDVIEDTEDIEQYGFSSPTNQVTGFDGGRETTFTIGMQNSITDKYYLMVNYDESKVYVVDSSMLTACGYSIEDLTPEETTE